MKGKASGGVLNKILAALASTARAKTLALKSKTRALRTRLIIFSLLSNRKFLMSTISHKLHGAFAHHHHLDKKLESHDDDDCDDDHDGDGEGGAKDSEGDGAVVLYRDYMDHNTVPDPVHTGSVSVGGNIADGSDYHGYDDGGGAMYPDRSHSMFGSEDLEFEDPGGSVIELVKNSRQEAGESFSLEEEIDEVAELFIKRFHRQIRMQKQRSFREFQEMLQRGL